MRGWEDAGQIQAFVFDFISACMVGFFSEIREKQLVISQKREEWALFGKNEFKIILKHLNTY